LNKFCSNGKQDNHNTQDCRFLKKTLVCDNCNKRGHLKKDCWGLVGRPSKRGADNTGKQQGNNKRQQRDKANMNTEEIITFGAKELKAAEKENVNDNGIEDLDEGYDVDTTDPNDKHILYYDWLANSTTTAHVTNQHEVFTTYHPAKDATIVGVGNIKTNIHGLGTVLLESWINKQMFILRLENILHVPMNRNSLLSLGRWDDAGGSYYSHGGNMTLIKDGNITAKDKKIRNNLYKMNIHVRKMAVKNTVLPITCAITKESPTWEVWH
jgi:hypothetical protein